MNSLNTWKTIPNHTYVTDRKSVTTKITRGTGSSTSRSSAAQNVRPRDLLAGSEARGFGAWLGDDDAGIPWPMLSRAGGFYLAK